MKRKSFRAMFTAIQSHFFKLFLRLASHFQSKTMIALFFCENPLFLSVFLYFFHIKTEDSHKKKLNHSFSIEKFRKYLLEELAHGINKNRL